MSRNARRAAANQRREQFTVMFLHTMFNYSVEHAKKELNKYTNNNPQEKTIYMDGFNTALGRLNNIRSRTAVA